MTTFINIHTLISHPSSMMNRDDAGLQKTAIFGGTTRARISSQCLKRAIRNSDIYRKNVAEVSIRTDRYEDFISICKSNLPDYKEKDIKEVIKNLGSKTKVKPETKIRHFDAVQPYSIGEIRELLAMVEGGLAVKDIKKQQLVPTLDVCLSGRMDASATNRNVEAAMSVAHSLTTHEANIEVDWFTACDDLSPQGSGHIDTNEFSSGVFYRYATINLDLLKENSKMDEQKITETIKMLIKAFSSVTPPAKEKTFAAHTLSEFVLVTKSSQPLSLANAFRKPIDNSGQVMENSIKAIVEHFNHLKSCYELDDVATGVDLAGVAKEIDTTINWKNKISEITL